MTDGPLAGVRVVDFSLYLPGPYASRVLCDLGAEVIKVEPLSGDPGAEFMPGDVRVPRTGASGSCGVNLKHPDGVALAHEPDRGSADAVAGGFRPGASPSGSGSASTPCASDATRR